MMYHFGLESYIDYIVDDHPSKHGCYSPGQHIPVFSTSKIYEEKPDYIYLLAWQHQDTILKKHNNYISITWDKRPLQAFADKPIEQMTDQYDLIVIDYPHVGEVSANGLLDNFDKLEYTDQLSKLFQESVGQSHKSYFVDNHQSVSYTHLTLPTKA